MEDNSFHKVVNGRGYVLAPIFQWRSIFKAREYNWINFTAVKLDVEAGRYKGSYWEFTIILLGIGFYFESYDVDSRSGFGDKLRDILENSKTTEVTFDEDW